MSFTPYYEMRAIPPNVHKYPCEYCYGCDREATHYLIRVTKEGRIVHQDKKQICEDHARQEATWRRIDYPELNKDDK